MEKMRRDTIYLDAMLFDVLQLAGILMDGSVEVLAMLRCASLQYGKATAELCSLC